MTLDRESDDICDQYIPKQQEIGDTIIKNRYKIER
jgi:hypothetical protein